ncbi:glucokinase [Jhaorihella thermophila]
MDAREILRRASSADPAVERAVTLFASALGDLSRDLSALYLPRGGLVFAGSVSVGILNCGTAREAFLKVFLRDPDHLPPPHEIAISLVTEDAAALWGGAWGISTKRLPAEQFFSSGAPSAQVPCLGPRPSGRRLGCLRREYLTAR